MDLSVNQNQDHQSTTFSQTSKKSYSKAQVAILYDKIRELSNNPTQYSLLMLMVGFELTNHPFFMKQETIAKEVKVSAKTISREVQKLIKANLITVVKKATQHTSFILRLNDVFLSILRVDNLAILENPDRTNCQPDQTNCLPSDQTNCPTIDLKSHISIIEGERARATLPEKENISDPLEQPEKEKLTAEQLDIASVLKPIVWNGKYQTNFIPKRFLIPIGMSFEECAKIVEYARTRLNQCAIQQSTLLSETSLRDALLKIQGQMNAVKVEEKHVELSAEEKEFHLAKLRSLFHGR